MTEVSSSSPDKLKLAPGNKESFPNYMQVPKRIPNIVWHTLRFFAMVILVAECILLIKNPDLGLFIFWFCFISWLPLLFFVAPGFWRNICPLVSVNQIPRELNFTMAKSASKWMKEYCYLITWTLVLFLIPLRKYLLSSHAASLVVIIGIMMSLAFFLGIVFKGKSGWCSMICPLLPFQRVYGQTPFIKVRNYHCRPCVGCAELCYDFNPEISYIALLNGPNRFVSGYIKLFAASLPGLILAFYLIPNPPEITFLQMNLQFWVYLGVSIASFHLLTLLVRVRESKIATFYGALSINIFYFLSFPVMIAKYNEVFGLSIPAQLHLVLSGIILAMSIIWLIRSYRKENLFFDELVKPMQVADIEQLEMIEEKVKQKCMITIQPGNHRIVAEPGTTLLNLLEERELPIEAGCRMGMCGADPVQIIKGQENLAPPEPEELATLKRLGLSEGCRMACCCKVKGNVEVSLETKKSSRDLPTTTPVSTSVNNVVIIGNGVSGMTAAYHIYQKNPNCRLTVIGEENHNYYNRMAITRLIYERSAMKNLSMLPSDWDVNPYADCWISTLVTKIDRENKQVITALDEVVPYDKLILAMGSKAFIPPIENYGIPGCFVVRTADDAISMRDYIQHHHVKNAILLGGSVLGIETAFALYKLKLEVTVIERSPWLLYNFIDQRSAKYLEEYLKNLGVVVKFGYSVKAALGTNELKGVALDDGTIISGGLFIVCCGISPNIELAKECGLVTERGIVVDETLRTSDPDIFAIGDNAQINGRIEGLWTSSIRQADVCGENVMDGNEKYVGTSSDMILKLPGVILVSKGVINPRSEDEFVIEHDDPENKIFHRLVFSRENLIGAVIFGSATYISGITRAINQKISLSDKIGAIHDGDLSIFV